MSNQVYEKMLAVRVIPANIALPVETRDIGDTLRNYQGLVDGWIEVVPLPHLKMQPRAKGRIVMIVNEEGLLAGLLAGLPPNPRASQIAKRPIVGDVFLVVEQEEYFSDYKAPIGIVGKS